MPSLAVPLGRRDDGADLVVLGLTAGRTWLHDRAAHGASFEAARRVERLSRPVAAACRDDHVGPFRSRFCGRGD